MLMTDDEVRAAYSEYQAGISLRDVADLHYVSYPTIQNGFKRLGLPTRARGANRKRPLLDEEQIREAISLRDEGMQLYLIARQLKVGKEYIRMVINKYESTSDSE